MSDIVGPIQRDKIVLCSADASPQSQKIRGKAAFFFPGAKWVGAVRNASERLGCRFVIITTGHGLVNPDDEITKYDKHIIPYKEEVKKLWEKTIPLLLDNNVSLMIFYPGGCPRDLYIEILSPILSSLKISLITFGKPNMVDVNKIDNFVNLITKGTSIDELKSILKCPERLRFYSNV